MLLLLTHLVTLAVLSRKLQAYGKSLAQILTTVMHTLLLNIVIMINHGLCALSWSGRQATMSIVLHIHNGVYILSRNHGLYGECSIQLVVLCIDSVEGGLIPLTIMVL